MALELVAFTIALVAGLYKLLKAKPTPVSYILLNIFVSGCVSLLLVSFGGFLFPAEAVELTRATVMEILLGHFFSAFIGAIIAPLAELLGTIKL